MLKITVLIYLDSNNASSLILCIDRLCQFSNVERVILINNGVLLSTDVIDYIINKQVIISGYTDKQAYGYALDNTLKNFGIKSDILILDASMMVHNSYSIDSLNVTAYSTLNAGCVTCIPNCRSWQVISPNEKLVYIKQETLSAVGGFSRELQSKTAVIKDFAIMALKKGYITITDSRAVFKDNMKDSIDSDYELDINKMEHKWGMHYFNTTPNINIVNDINDNRKVFKVLEVGCDLGATLLEVKNRYPGAIVYGTDISKGAINIAKHLLDNAVVSNIEEKNFRYEPESFDYIIFGDVLEHLRDPLGAVEYCKQFLKASGSIIASIPNVMHISIMKQLLNGEFTYTEFGLLDKTHIHLFTKKEIEKMFIEAGYTIKSIRSLKAPISMEDGGLIEWLLTNSGKDVTREMYETFQYLCIIKK